MTELSKRNDGGPAFPFAATDQSNVKFQNGGMNLRAYFAGQALMGMLAHGTRYKPRDGRADWHSAIAEESAQLADAMIAALDEKANP